MLGKLLKFVMFALGAGLFIWILSDVDLAAVGRDIVAIGSMGAAAIMLAFTVSFISDAASWMLMFRSISVSLAWFWRLTLVQFVGEALNVITPFGSLGGEPFKALLLKRHYDVSYREGTGALLLVQTINSLAMVPFILVGAVMMLGRGIFSPLVEMLVLAAAIVIGAFMLLVYAALHFRWLAALERRLGGSRWRARIGPGLHAMRDIEEHLFSFVRHTPGRFTVSLILAFFNWIFGAVEMYLIFWFLGHPISMADAWMVEATVALVRAVTFFIPGHLGVQDGAIALMGQSLAGTPEIGVTVALLRRGRELAWTAVGLVIGVWFGLRKPHTGAPSVTA